MAEYIDRAEVISIIKQEAFGKKRIGKLLLLAWSKRPPPRLRR